MTNETIKNTLAVGQVWREYSPNDLGDLQLWQIAAIGRKVAIAMNCATLKQVTITQDGLSTFTFECYRDSQNDNRIPADIVKNAIS